MSLIVSDPDVSVLPILGQNLELTLKFFKVPGSGSAPKRWRNFGLCCVLSNDGALENVRPPWNSRLLRRTVVSDPEKSCDSKFCQPL